MPSGSSLSPFQILMFYDKRVTEQIFLDPLVNKTGDVWHVFLKGDFENMLYGYNFDGKFCPEGGHYFDSSQIVLDPYAKATVSRGEYGVLGPEDDCWPPMAGMVPSAPDQFDWEGDTTEGVSSTCLFYCLIFVISVYWEGDLPLKFLQRDLVIYEMHVRGFTNHESSGTKCPGTYLGIVEKLDHLKELGVNCIELMPCHEFNELEYYSYNSVLGDYKFNFWGYSTVNFFSPMGRYASAGLSNCGLGAINEFKYLVKEAHKRGIEVIMDVVFNHTAEGNENGPIVSFRGIDGGVFYMLAPKGRNSPAALATPAIDGIISLGDSSIYYNAGFKSYEITRCKEGADIWYDWIERSRNLMRRVKISIKVLRWLVSVFIEASKVQGNVIKKWNLKDHFSKSYCSLNYNENGRYVSFIAIQGQNKSVIITPETSYKGG
ncbi:Isoamylase 1, chloroplastic [Capsicum annuum]|uniref:Isoamylase 1, chloroplastic n=1 Tax=Capsicum annuum TaxID=4072 RepID=A0A2G2Z246_CAPAN|nr:Isoamylase 1, chloroplastic [Capsicum annuum]